MGRRDDDSVGPHRILESIDPMIPTDSLPLVLYGIMASSDTGRGLGRWKNVPVDSHVTGRIKLFVLSEEKVAVGVSDVGLCTFELIVAVESIVTIVSIVVAKVPSYLLALYGTNANANPAR